jgi:hypothetical protein
MVRVMRRDSPGLMKHPVLTSFLSDKAIELLPSGFLFTLMKMVKAI